MSDFKFEDWIIHWDRVEWADIQDALYLTPLGWFIVAGVDFLIVFWIIFVLYRSSKRRG